MTEFIPSARRSARVFWPSFLVYSFWWIYVSFPEIYRLAPSPVVSCLVEMPARYFTVLLGQNLKHARNAAGLRQIDVEEKIGITYRYYQTIETGRANVTLKTLYELSKLFKVPIETLLKAD